MKSAARPGWMPTVNPGPFSLPPLPRRISQRSRIDTLVRGTRLSFPLSLSPSRQHDVHQRQWELRDLEDVHGVAVGNAIKGVECVCLGAGGESFEWPLGCHIVVGPRRFSFTVYETRGWSSLPWPLLMILSPADTPDALRQPTYSRYSGLLL